MVEGYDRSIEPIVTRKRKMLAQIQENHNDPSEKTFSFKDSLRESTKNKGSM